MILRLKKYIYMLAVLLGAAVMSGCLKDKIETDTGNESGEAMVKLSLNVPGNVTATRGMTTTQESAVKSVNVLVFDKNDKLSYMRNGDIQVSGNTVSFEALYKISKNAADKYRLVVLVNSQWRVNSLFGGSHIDSHVGVTSYTTAMAMLEETAPQTYAEWLTEGLPMWGEYSEAKQITFGMTLPVMPVIRSVARIDVGVNPTPTYNADGSAVWGELSNFSLEEVIIYKAGKKYMIAPEFNDFDFVNRVVTDINLPSSQELRSTHPKYTIENSGRAGGVSTGRGIHLSSQIYLPETDVNLDGGAYLDTDHLNRIAMVVGGKYNGSTQMSYYRIDFVKSSDRTKLHDLRRNHCYQAVIKNVIGSGFDDPDDAYKSYVSQIEATINEWETGSTTGVVMDGENILTLSRDMVFCGNEGSVAGPIESVVKTTNTTAGLTITGPFEAGSTTVTASWVTSPSVTAVTSDTDAQLGSVKKATISIGQIGTYSGSADREAYFLVKSGNMEYEYRIVQSKDKWITLTPFPDGNCYPMDGGLHSMQAASRTGWEVDITDGNQNDVVSDLHTVKGGRKPSGEGVYFSTIDDIDKGLKSESHVRFTFTDPKGVCPDENITVPVVTGFTIAGNTNTYMLKPSASVKTGIYIPMTRPNHADVIALAGSQQTIGDADGLSSSFDWTNCPRGAAETAPVQYYCKSGKGKTGYLFAQQGKDPSLSPGSTVLSIKAEGVVKWTWLIWTTSYDPNSITAGASNGRFPTALDDSTIGAGNLYRYSTTLSNRNHVWMDRNLGASSATPGDFGSVGIGYQWGRHNPLPMIQDWSDNPGLGAYDQFGTNLTGTGLKERINPLPGVAGSVPLSIKNPDKVINGGNNISWYSLDGTPNINLWGQTGGKTVWDPCPAGWRLPVADSSINVETGSPWASPWGNVGTPSVYTTEPFDHGYNFTRSNYLLGWYPATASGTSGSYINAFLRSNYQLTYIRFSNTEIVLAAASSAGSAGSLRCVKQ